VTGQNTPNVSEESERERTTFVATSFVPWKDDHWRSPLDLPVLAVLAWSLWRVGDVSGLAVGAALALSWLLVSNVAVFAAGVVALTALVPGDAPPEVLVVPAVALTGLLVTTSGGTGRIRETLVLLATWGVLSGAAVVVFAGTNEVWIAGVCVLVLAIAGYVSLNLTLVSGVDVSTDE